MTTCETHNEPYIWIQLAPGKRVFRCLSCHNGDRPPTEAERKFPKIKYAQNFHRERNYTDFEKRAPFGKARKPKW